MREGWIKYYMQKNYQKKKEINEKKRKKWDEMISLLAPNKLMEPKI